MMLSLDSKEMLQLWRRCAGLEPSNSSCTVVRFDGVDVDTRLSEEMRSWYLELLDTGDRALVGQPHDLSSLLRCSVTDGRLARLEADAKVRRVTSVRLEGWCREIPVADLDADEAARIAALAANPFSCPGNANPRAWRDASGDVWVVPAAEVVSARGYADTGADCYCIDERAIATIPRSFSII